MQSTLRSKPEAKETKGSWYGIVFGVDEDRDEPLHKPEEYITYNHRGHLRCGSSVNEKVHEFFNKICWQLEKFGEIVVSFHNGYTDKNCAFHGYHWHVYLHARLHPTSDARWGKELQALGRASPAGERMYLAAMAARSHALLKHIIRAPREIKWQQGMEIEELLTKLTDEINAEKEDDINWDPAKVKEDRNVGRIKVLMQLMEKYATIAQNQLRRKMLKEDDSDDPNSDWNKYVQILATPSFEQIWKKAVSLMKSTYLNKDITKLFELPLNTKDVKYHTVKESIDAFQRWCKAQEIDELDFVTKLFNVLKRKVPKLNTFAIQGAPNSGKSFILRSLLPWYRWWGEIRLDAQGYAFAFENAVDVGIIFIEEPVIGPVQVEQMKLLMEGMGTYVKCKRIGDEFVERTPLLITHNDCLSRFVSSIDRAAMDTRMYHFETRTQPWLIEYTKMLNPGIWPILWKIHGLDIQEMMDNDDDIPTASQQAAMEEEARTSEFTRTEISQEEVEEIFEPPLAKKIRQLDGPFDDSDDTDDEEHTHAKYREKVEEFQDTFNDLIKFTMAKVDTEYSENNCVQNHLKDRLETDIGWEIRPLTADQEEEMTKIEAFWTQQANTAITDKWRFIESITKKSSVISRDNMIKRTDEYVAARYPIIRALGAMQNVLYYMEHKIKKVAAVEVANIMADEIAVGLAVPTNTPNVPPGAPKCKRSRRVNRSEVKLVRKRIKFGHTVMVPENDETEHYLPM